MTRERSDRDVADMLDVWMSEVAPAGIPVPVLEEAFARTMSSRQVRVYPWQRLVGRGGRSRIRVTFALVATAALLVTVLALALLGGGSEVPPAPSQTPSATPHPSTSPSSSPSPPALIPVPIQPTASVAVSQPRGLASDGTAVWVLSGTGLVRRIDPATNTLGPAVSTGPTDDFYQGIAAAGNGVWVTQSNTATLFRVDPVRSTVAATINVGLAPKGVLATGSAVWVADTHDGKVRRIDPATNEVVATITVGPTGSLGPNWLATGFGSIWVGVPNAGTIVRIDPTTNAVQATIPIALLLETAPNGRFYGGYYACGEFAITPTAVWITSCDGGSRAVVRIDPSTNSIVAATAIDGRAYNTPAVIGGAPWVSVDTSPKVPGTLARISSVTNAVDLELAPSAAFGGGGDMVVAAASVWVIDSGNDRVLRLPLTGFPSG